MSHSTYHVPDLSSENQEQQGLHFYPNPDQTQIILILDPAEIPGPLTRPFLESAFAAMGFKGFALRPEVLDELTALDLSQLSGPVTRICALQKPLEGIDIQISADALKAWLTLEPSPASSPPERVQILNSLKKAGIVYGIKEDILDAVLTQGRAQKVLIAEGLPAQKGKGAWFEFLLANPEDSQGPKLRADGSVNYRELNQIQSVEPDTPLMRKHPPEPGTPGKRVTGEEIPAETGRDYHLSESPGTRISDQDKNLLLSSRSGRPVRLSRSVKVEDVISIENVGLETGNIQFNGSVMIMGSVNSGFEVRARGDIIVHGSVEDAILEAGGNIEIKGSVYGRENTSLSARGDIQAAFIQNASVECFGDLHIHDGLFHCQIRVMGNIFVGCNGGKGQINGGKIWGANSLKARILGSMASTATHISLGEDPYLRQKLKDIDHNLRHHKNELEQVIKSIIYIRTRAMEKASELGNLEEKRSELLETVNMLSEHINNLHESLRMSRSQSEVCVMEQLHAGVRLFFAEIPYLVNEDMGPSRLRLRESQSGPEVAWSPYSKR
ncbi:hypothetical protein COW36_12295 [bacterium (Candidatus Blackallbacteria) CG17_big_fil_post_rev_8_21_14_2_50_48_46]|uniref:Flagellar Assembly Protein A N-terminal region domain-containing protein n=1 Tax=bacterium (Candidatus Blackallbacteria) CG17_big_fil_post_rev_8_21_14_2_50_48_46 TaxID=2014261 RepID=A0A2M7G3T9_9BACT|nr:MAG: hypothetical protein COW64_02965 [bacterium (Candidatus Blackallbacteria) CG18_big_fil_WC_8_21_14_2_50_49_26]PIW16540.1 MAG: hypothetical protein COW36_12295 [bacterium (Candidatus Blackallbacteria) CG17_big_fil_post_rev_8_21_14_2_50_48_46]PIW46048.1 MAG: hypothetical protein COW20_17560 [bacterium (Candidatus Blackallbacteria) CG13_big_fil_rev_8_21_14_2_50_49_14]